MVTLDGICDLPLSCTAPSAKCVWDDNVNVVRSLTGVDGNGLLRVAARGCRIKDSFGSVAAVDVSSSRFILLLACLEGESI